MSLFLSYVALTVGVVLAAICVNVILQLILSNKSEVKKNAARVRKFSDLLMGRAHTSDDWLPDGRVQAGMIYNKKMNRIEVSGRLSDESIERAFSR